MRTFKTGFAILGGTFDPVHHGHLRIAIEARELLAVDAVKLVPCYMPYHRGQADAGVQNRIDMLELAIEGIDGLEVDEVECRRKGPSYTVDTLRHYRQYYGDQCPLVLLLGLDTFATLHEWHEWESLGELANIAIIERPGYKGPLPTRVANWLQPRLTDEPRCLMTLSHGLCCYLKLTQMDISASSIRDRISNKHSVDFLLPRPVIAYIVDNHLYGSDLDEK